MELPLSAYLKNRSDEPDTTSESPVDWLKGNVFHPFANSVAIEPYNACTNVVNGLLQTEILEKGTALPVAEPEFQSPGWYAQSISGGLGAVIPYAIAAKGTSLGLRSASAGCGLTGKTALFMRSELTAQVAGAAMLDFARDTRPGETHLGNAAGGATGFFIFGKGNAFAATENFWARQGTRLTVGSIGGMAQFTTARLVSGYGLPEREQLVQSAVTGATMNVALPPTHSAISKILAGGVQLKDKISLASEDRPGSLHESIRGLYYDARWRLDKAHTEARRQTYGLLNYCELRHPIQRLSALLGGADNTPLRPRAALTPENNPVSAFEQKLPKFFKQIAEQEQVFGSSQESSGKNSALGQMKTIRTEFAQELLAIWHGTAERPGLAQYTDAELATPNVPAERVAQIRQALSSTSRMTYPNPSPLTQALLELAPVEIRKQGHLDGYELNEIAAAKEKFFGYDERELQQRMRMPSGLAWQDHEYGTPLDWMPYEPTSQLPNLFHGSVSNSLPSVLTEGAMLSAIELRLRGIKQTTGESANESHPRRAISITRDFNEAWAYHRHSPERLTDFPIVFGISQHIVKRAWPAGLSEPGEILVDKIRMGSTMLGLRPAEISHVYVPDSEIGPISRMIAARRIRDVAVLGLSEMKAPPWKPEPPAAEW